ncbi:hypothetical protein LL962_16205 [Xanthomonas sp. NCPPB 1067]|uniref:hypothetical protein n=1 Tax=Xanthomonas sp. NCPPB 1067 TaxID=487524 RepID=UPI001E3931C0|nr:hypothetical protein [Xanthomonas sp. NCPPB 1067]MCC4588625.1 hypothetical protein [Xanthomonas sp. NCPPB 1067]
MTAVPISSLLLLGLAALIMHWLCWRYFWRRYARPASRADAVLRGTMALVFMSVPALFLREALSTGEVRCLGRRCAGVSFDVASDPANYWLRVFVLMVVCVFFFTGLLAATAKPERVAGPDRSS